MTNLTIKERIRLIEPEVRDAVFFIPHPRDITEKILDSYSIPKTKEYLNYLMYTTEGVISNKDVIEGYLKDCIKGFEGTYEPFRESITFGYGFRPLSEEEFVYKGEEFIQDSRWSTQDTPAIKKIDNITYKRIDNITYKEIISEEELKTYKGTLEWKDNKKYLILYGTGSYSIATGSREDTDEEIIKAYRKTLKKTLR